MSQRDALIPRDSPARVSSPSPVSPSARFLKPTQASVKKRTTRHSTRSPSRDGTSPTPRPHDSTAAAGGGASSGGGGDGSPEAPPGHKAALPAAIARIIRRGNDVIESRRKNATAMAAARQASESAELTFKPALRPTRRRVMRVVDNRPFLDRSFDFQIHRRIVIENLARDVSEARQRELTFQPAITALASQLRTAAPFSERLDEDAAMRRNRLEELRGAYRLAEVVRNNACVPRVSFALAARYRRRAKGGGSGSAGALLGAASLHRNAEPVDSDAEGLDDDGGDGAPDQSPSPATSSIPPFSVAGGSASGAATGGGGGGSAVGASTWAAGAGAAGNDGDGFVEAFPEIAEVREAVKQQFGGVGGALYADALLRHARAAEISRQLTDQANRTASRGVSSRIRAYEPPLAARRAKLTRAYAAAAARVREEMISSLQSDGAAASSPLAVLSSTSASRSTAAATPGEGGIPAYVLDRVRREAALQSAALVAPPHPSDGIARSPTELQAALAEAAMGARGAAANSVSGLVRVRLGRRLKSAKSSVSLGFETRRAVRLALAARVRKLQVTASATKAALAAIEEEGSGGGGGGEPGDSDDIVLAAAGIDDAEGDGGAAIGPHSSCKDRLTVVGHVAHPSAAAAAAAEVAQVHPAAAVPLDRLRERATAWQTEWAVKQLEHRAAKAAAEVADLAQCTFKPRTMERPTYLDGAPRRLAAAVAAAAAAGSPGGEGGAGAQLEESSPSHSAPPSADNQREARAARVSRAGSSGASVGGRWTGSVPRAMAVRGPDMSAALQLAPSYAHSASGASVGGPAGRRSFVASDSRSVVDLQLPSPLAAVALQGGASPLSQAASTAAPHPAYAGGSPGGTVMSSASAAATAAAGGAPADLQPPSSFPRGYAAALRRSAKALAERQAAAAREAYAHPRGMSAYDPMATPVLSPAEFRARAATAAGGSPAGVPAQAADAAAPPGSFLQSPSFAAASQPSQALRQPLQQQQQQQSFQGDEAAAAVSSPAATTTTTFSLSRPAAAVPPPPLLPPAPLADGSPSVPLAPPAPAPAAAAASEPRWASQLGCGGLFAAPVDSSRPGVGPEHHLARARGEPLHPRPGRRALSPSLRAPASGGGGGGRAAAAPVPAAAASGWRALGAGPVGGVGGDGRAAAAGVAADFLSAPPPARGAPAAPASALPTTSPRGRAAASAEDGGAGGEAGAATTVRGLLARYAASPLRAEAASPPPPPPAQQQQQQQAPASPGRTARSPTRGGGPSTPQGASPAAGSGGGGAGGVGTPGARSGRRTTRGGGVRSPGPPSSIHRPLPAAAAAAGRGVEQQPSPPPRQQRLAAPAITSAAAASTALTESPLDAFFAREDAQQASGRQPQVQLAPELPGWPAAAATPEERYAQSPPRAMPQQLLQEPGGDSGGAGSGGPWPASLTDAAGPPPPLADAAVAAAEAALLGDSAGGSEEELLLNLEVQLAPGYAVTVPVRRGDEPSSLASRFVRAYGLEAVPGVVAMLTRMIQEQVAGLPAAATPPPGEGAVTV